MQRVQKQHRRLTPGIPLSSLAAAVFRLKMSGGPLIAGELPFVDNSSSTKAQRRLGVERRCTAPRHKSAVDAGGTVSPELFT